MPVNGASRVQDNPKNGRFDQHAIYPSIQAPPLDDLVSKILFDEKCRAEAAARTNWNIETDVDRTRVNRETDTNTTSRSCNSDIFSYDGFVETLKHELIGYLIYKYISLLGISYKFVGFIRNRMLLCGENKMSVFLSVLCIIN